jgi:uncharacterized protein YebE (UPF0316 family)
VPLPLLIFFAEMCVVTLSTMRIIFVSRGRRFLAPLLGFFEVCIWLFAVGQTMRHLDDLFCSVGFAGGFTLGSFFGILLERLLALGTVVIRIITSKDAELLLARLHEAGFGATSVDGQGATGPVKVVLSVVPRRRLGLVMALLKEIDPKLFYSIDDIQAASEGIFPRASTGSRLIGASLSRMSRTAA